MFTQHFMKKYHKYSFFKECVRKYSKFFCKMLYFKIFCRMFSLTSAELVLNTLILEAKSFLDFFFEAQIYSFFSNIFWKNWSYKKLIFVLKISISNKDGHIEFQWVFFIIIHHDHFFLSHISDCRWEGVHIRGSTKGTNICLLLLLSFP